MGRAPSTGPGLNADLRTPLGPALCQDWEPKPLSIFSTSRAPQEHQAPSLYPLSLPCPAETCPGPAEHHLFIQQIFTEPLL